MKTYRSSDRVASTSLAKTLAIVLGIFLLIEGAWGFYDPVVFGILTTNHLHASIHLILGAVAFWSLAAGNSRGFLFFLGTLLATVGVLWFVPGPSALVVSLFAVNKAVAILNIAVGAVALLVAARSRPFVLPD